MNNVTWTFNGDGTLTICGTGKMTEYDVHHPPPPWYGIRTAVKTVVIEKGVTSIGGFAFLNCTNLISVTIPDSVTSIGETAFTLCTNLTGITIPDSITSIGDCAFLNCTSLTNVYYTGSKSQWDSIGIGRYNDSLHKAAIHYSSAASG